MSLKDTFSKLKGSIVGTKTVSIDTSLDNAIKDISSFRESNRPNGIYRIIKKFNIKTI